MARQANSSSARNNPLLTAIGLLVVLSSIGLTGFLKYDLLGYDLQTLSLITFPTAFILTLFIAQRNIGAMTGLEVGAVVITGLGFIAQYAQWQPFMDFMLSHNPWSQLAYVLISLGAFYALSTRLALTQMAGKHPFKIILGITVLISATTLSGLADASIMGENLQQWVYLSYPAALITGFIVARREIGSVRSAELVLGFIAFVTYALIVHSQRFAAEIQSSTPIAGVFVIISLLAFLAFAGDEGLFSFLKN